MPNGPSTETKSGWKTAQVYAMASICLLVGVALGSSIEDRPLARASRPHSEHDHFGEPAFADRESRRHEADGREEGRTSPCEQDYTQQLGSAQSSRSDLQGAHQFDEAAEYFEKAVAASPTNVAARTDPGSCLYYKGDVAGAIAQLQQALNYDPNDGTHFQSGHYPPAGEGRQKPRGR